MIKAAGAYANPDYGASPDEDARRAGLRVMYQMTAGNSHVKYNPGVISVPDAVRISKEVGYKGLYCIEAISRDPYAEVTTVRDLLLKLI